MTGVSIQNVTRQHLKVGAGAMFTAIANEVLPKWDISLAFVTSAKARALNKRLRNKEYIPNVLSYVAGEKSGEVIICLSEAAKQAPTHQMDERTFVLYLFIHGLLHLKGWAHGATMEACERKLVRKYGTANSNRHRHRHVPSKGGGGRGTL